MKNRKFIFIFLLLIYSSVYAQNNESETTDNPLRVDETTIKLSPQDGEGNPNVTISNGVGLRDYLIVIVVLILVIGLLYVVLRIIKKIGGNRIGLDNDLIHVLSTKALKGTTALHLIEVGKQVFLIGATDSSINVISEITEKETKDMISLNISSDNVPQTSFFKNFTDKLNTNNSLDSLKQASSTIKTNRDKLEKF